MTEFGVDPMAARVVRVLHDYDHSYAFEPIVPQKADALIGCTTLSFVIGL